VAGVEREKPDPHYLRRGLEALGTEDALYVGDSQTDFLAARRAGVDSAFVRRPHRVDLAPDPAPTHTVADLRERRSLLETGAASGAGPSQ